METRILGKDLKVSAVGLGCMGFSHAYGHPTDRAEAVRAIREAAEMGYTFFDTAECYTGDNADGTESNNEELVGEALRDVRDKVVIATKFGVSFKRQAAGGSWTDSRPETIRESVEGSLKRLGVECIDLYYQHRVDPEVEPEVVADTMADLIREGKITHWGISEVGEEYLRRAHAVCPVTAIQNRYSMMAREYEPLFPTLDELGITLVAFSPLANGFLSDAYNASMKFEQGVDYRSFMPQFTPEGFEASAELLKMIRSLAESKNATPAQLSLAWMLCKKPWIVPIPGTRKPERMRENLGAADVKLSAEEVEALDRLLDSLPQGGVFGGRR